MLKDLPSTPAALINWKWEEIGPHYKIIEACPLTTANADEWLTDWLAWARNAKKCMPACTWRPGLSPGQAGIGGGLGQGDFALLAKIP